MENRGSVQAVAVRRSRLRPHRVTGCGRGYGMTVDVGTTNRILGPPEVGDNPCAQQVVAEITERAGRAVRAAINSIAIARNPPVMPEVRSFHGKEPVAGILAQRKAVPGSNRGDAGDGIEQAAAGRGS